MEAVEYLVVGKDADAEIIVGKAFVKGIFNGREYRPNFRRGGKLLRLEDFAKAFVLFLAVSEDIDLVAFQLVVLESLFQQVEVFVEKRLDSDVEVKCSIGL